MAIAEPSTEPKIIQYVSMLKWASANIKDKWSSLHESLIAAKTGKCFAKGAGLRNGIAGRRSKFTIIISGKCFLFHHFWCHVVWCFFFHPGTVTNVLTIFVVLSEMKLIFNDQIFF